jgi:hypothetical protein
MPIAKTPVASGRKGGRARTPAKSLAARQNILLRWHPADDQGVIPLEALIDGAWYTGRGRSAPIACWDEVSRTFHTIQQSSWADPANYPAIARRTVRIKQERHIEASGGTFAPMRIVTAAAAV